MTNRNTYPGYRVASALAIGIGATLLVHAVDTEPVKIANQVVTEKIETNPYLGDEILIYAPLPLSAEEAIEHYVGMDRPRTDLSDEGLETVTDELVGAYEDQTGLDADQPFPRNVQGSQFIRIDIQPED